MWDAEEAEEEEGEETKKEEARVKEKSSDRRVWWMLGSV